MPAPVLLSCARVALLVLLLLLLRMLPQVHQGLLYVWPDASEGSAAAAEAAPLPVIPELDETEEWEPRTDWFMRDVPISMETVVENVSGGGGCRVVVQVVRPCSMRQRRLWVGGRRVVVESCELKVVVIQHSDARDKGRLSSQRGPLLLAGDGPLPRQLHAPQGAGGALQREGYRHQATDTTNPCR